MKKILDLHIHSKYSRACSKDLVLPKIAEACEVRGIDICATGDFTHPAWLEHIKDELVEVGDGIFGLKNVVNKTKFLLGTELSCIYKDKDMCRRLHLNVFFPKIEDVEKLNHVLENERGANIRSDGRPILGIPAKEILKIILDINERAVMIPAHAWTPWFAIFGSKSGYDSLEECFEELTPHVRAIETGLSSDPPMNWRLSALDKISLVSNSDAHSLNKLGREANVFNFKNEKEITYDEVMRIINEKDKEKFLYTIEFFPEEGKYHCDGHRDCEFSCTPDVTKKNNGLCPKCNRKLTIGVLNRVDELADRKQTEFKKVPDFAVPFKSIIPLREIISNVCKKGVNTKTVSGFYDSITKEIGSEFYILLHAPKKDLLSATTEEITEGIIRVREARVHVEPGYDGVFGKINVFKDSEKRGKQQGVLI